MRAEHARPVLAVIAVLLVAGCGGGGGGGGGAAAVPAGFRVIAVDPPQDAVAVPVDTDIRATFSDPVYVGTISDANFLVSLRATGDRVPGTVRLEGGNQVAVFTPAQPFYAATRYEARIFGTVRSFGNDLLGDDFVCHFTTSVHSNPPPPPPTPTFHGDFRDLDPMAVGRSSHEAVLLESGRVVVLGGFDTPYTVTSATEIFNPVTETFSNAAGSLGTGRAFHAATRLGDGRVLVAGGVGGPGLQELSTVEIFNPDTERFFAGPPMGLPRAFHTATLLLDGRVLIAGGTVPTPSGTYSSKTAEIYDPLTPAFTTLPDMAVYRASHTATLLEDGRVLIVGGNSTSSTAEIFDPATKTFSTLASSMKMIRRGHGAIRLPNGDVFLMGGEGTSARTAEIYEVANTFFRTAATYPIKHRKDHTINLTVDGWVLLTGGSRTEGTNVFFNQTTEQYRPAGGVFISNSPLLGAATTRHRGTTLADGRILVTGGSNIDWTLPELATVQIFEKDPE